jgi:pimeloyl-ACP methyl ester carboxylesterase
LADAGFRVVAPTQRGYAASARPTSVAAYRLDELVADVLALADELGRTRFRVVGHDWGGVVAWALGAAHPDRVQDLAVLATPHPAALVGSLWRSPQALRSAYVALFRTPRLPEHLLTARDGAVLRRALQRSGLPPTWADRYTAALSSPEALAGALAWYRASTPGGLRSIGEVTVPTLYVWADGDAALGRTAAEGTEDHVSGRYRFVRLRGVSHWIPETAAAETAELVLDHFADATVSR